MIPQADDGNRLTRIRARNEQRMREFHDQHHADPSHSCTFKVKTCRLCETNHPHNTTQGEPG